MKPNSLTYKDVRTILALLDGWPGGRIHFRAGTLCVDATTERDGEAHAEVSVTSPAVGIFKPEPVDGRVVTSGACIGHVEAPGRSTPVLATQQGRVMTWLAPKNAFVEYGQVLATMESER